MIALPAPAHAPGLALWRIDLDAPWPSAAVASLGDDERARAARFVFPRDRQRFIAAHAALRQLLAQHTGREAGQLRFTHGPFGKPALAQAPELPFNLSHSGGVALLAVGGTRAIGLDLELLRPMPDAPALASAHFTAAEGAALAGRAGAARDRAFLRCWTRKEACLKALGLGLQLAPKHFEVGLEAVACTVAIATAHGVAALTLEPVATGPDSLGSLALWHEPGGAAPRLNAPWREVVA